MKIVTIHAREILSAGSFPTIETTVTLENGTQGRASVPFGSSDGKYEASTLVDNDAARYQGFGVLKAIEHVNTTIASEIVGMDVLDQKQIDAKLIALDTTPKKELLGGNSILSVSLASARAASLVSSLPLYDYIRKAFGIHEAITTLPKPMMVVIEGGKHADNSTDFQEYLIAVLANMSSRNSVRAGIEIYHTVGKLLKQNGYNSNVGLEGAYAPSGIKSNSEPLAYLHEAIVKAGYKPGEEVGICMDPAASEFYSDGLYNLKLEQRKLTSTELIDYYTGMIPNTPLVSIEDGLDQDDWEAWTEMQSQLGEKLMIVGDDLTVTQVDRLRKAVDTNAINSIIIKPNQVGTLSETMETVLFAKEKNIKTIVSHRGGGETTDTFIIDLAVAISANFVKVGPSRGERVDKYNRLMEIGVELNL